MYKDKIDVFLPPFAPLQTFSVAEFQQRVDWGITATGVQDIWSKTKGEGAIVFVLDTGIDKKHSDLQCNILGGVNFTSDDFADWQDRNGHGTHVAGIIGACANQWGIVGVAPEAQIFACKVLADNGSGSTNWIARAIDFVISFKTDRKKIINLSLGANSESVGLKLACDKAHRANIPVIAAAGNDGTRVGRICYPALHDSTIAVAAYKKGNKISAFSQRGEKIDIAAPGEDIFSTTPNESYASFSGTSMATPFVSGVVALMLSLEPNLSVEDIRMLLVSSAIDVGEFGKDNQSGWGLIDPNNTIQPEPEASKPKPKPVETEEKYSVLEVLKMIYKSKRAIQRKRKSEVIELAKALNHPYQNKSSRILDDEIWAIISN